MTSQTIHLACLCAAWCRMCDDYALVLERAVADLSADGVVLQLHWIDIEDEAELVGDVDVETFPTVVIADQVGVLFAGPLTPQAEILRRLLRATVVDAQADARWRVADSKIESFAARLRSRSPR